MPGPTGGDSIATAVPVGVLPFSLYTKFTMTREWKSIVNEFHDGRRQSRSMLQATGAQSRRSWKLTKRLTPAAMATLRAFWESHATDSFYFYDSYESSSYDETGVTTEGRYTVRFVNQDFVSTVTWPRSEVSIELIECA